MPTTTTTRRTTKQSLEPVKLRSRLKTRFWQPEFNSRLIHLINATKICNLCDYYRLAYVWIKHEFEKIRFTVQKIILRGPKILQCSDIFLELWLTLLKIFGHCHVTSVAGTRWPCSSAKYAKSGIILE
jgi:hypothetical protein